MSTIEVTQWNVIMFFDIFGTVFMVGCVSLNVGGGMVMPWSIDGFVKVMLYFIRIPVLFLPHHI